MSDEQPKKDVHLGMFDKPRGRSLQPGDVIAAALSVLWVVICGLFLLMARRPESTLAFDTYNFLVTVLAVLLPIALIWVAAVAARSVSVVREESIRLQAAMDVLRQNYVELAQSKRLQVTPPAPPAQPTLAAECTAPGPAPGPTATPASTSVTSPPATSPPVTSPPVTSPPANPAHQPDLALGYPEDAHVPEMSANEFISALNFPKTPDDAAGFRALRKALKDPRANKLIQASQDVLTLLSQEGVYMDDLIPDRARPDIWRKFADGERGRPIAMLGGIRDRNSLAVAAQRMRQDHIFRDSAHHFLRQFDKVFAAFAVDASDAEIAALAETRTARAFMLLGRVAGTFD